MLKKKHTKGKRRKTNNERWDTMVDDSTWRSLRYYERIWPCRSFGAVYSPSGKYLLDYKIYKKRVFGHHLNLFWDWSCDNETRDVVIIDIETGFIKIYTEIKEKREIISCKYWLSDSEIVIVTQGEDPKPEIYESVFYRIYGLNHKQGTAELILKWNYTFPRFTLTIGSEICICPNRLIINKQSFCVLQVGPELVLLPWDVRRQNPSYPPLRIRISMDEYGDYNLMTPGENEEFTSWCNYYAYGSSVYLDVRRHEDWSTVMDRYLRIDLSNLDLTCSCSAFNEDSPEVSLQIFDQLNDMTNVRYDVDSTWCQGDYIVKSQTYIKNDVSYLAVINLKNGTAFKVPIFYEEQIWTCRSFGAVYSPSGKYLLDYKFNGCRYNDIVIINMEVGYMKMYTRITDKSESISCNYWLSDSEIVIITQGEDPRSEEYESVFYRIYTLDHKQGTAELMTKWKYIFPRFTTYAIGYSICICSNPVIIHKQVFCILQVGPELVLLPWDVRRQNPSYPPIRIRINMDEYGDYNLMRPHESDGESPSWCNYYAYGSSIYLDVRRHEDWSTVLNRYLRIDISNLDLTCHCIVFNKDSPEVSLQIFNQLNDMTNVRYSVDSTWCQGDYIVKSQTFITNDVSHLAVINLKNGTAFKVPIFYEEHRTTFTVYKNKILAWREFEDDNEIPRFQYKLIRGNHFPIQNLRQICWEKVHLTEFYNECLLSSPPDELLHLTFDNVSVTLDEPHSLIA